MSGKHDCQLVLVDLIYCWKIVKKFFLNNLKLNKITFYKVVFIDKVLTSFTSLQKLFCMNNQL